jgi:cysteine desulfurase/selenocysteine lyase
MTNFPDIASIRNDFPILNEVIGGKQLVYFDNAATTQKPRIVLDALSGYYEHYNANIHRGIHHLAEKATAAFEDSRRRVQKFINAPLAEQVIFTYGTTDSINLCNRCRQRNSGVENYRSGERESKRFVFCDRGYSPPGYCCFAG